MRNEQSFSRFVISVSLIVLLVTAPSWGQQNMLGTDKAISEPSRSPDIPDLKTTLAKELAGSQPTSLSSLAAVHALNPFRAPDMARISGGQDTAEETRQVEKKGWWGRNWPWVVAPALAVGVGVAVAAAAGAFHHDNSDEGRMMWSRP